MGYTVARLPGVEGGQSDQESCSRRGHQPVAGQLGGREGKEDQHGQKPGGGKPTKGQGHGQGGADLKQNAPQTQQQQGREGKTGQHQNDKKIPRALMVVIHHPGETLQIVVTKKTVPVGLALPQQSNGKPGGGKHQGESETSTRAQPPPQPSSLRAKQPKQREAEDEQDNRHRSLAEHGQRQHTPAGPPRTLFSREGAPRQQQAEGEGGGEQGIAHLGATPHQHERTQGKSEGCIDGRGEPTQSGRGGTIASQARWRPAQEGVAQGHHRGHAGQSGGQPGRPAAKGIPLLGTGKGIEAAHQPVDQGRLVVSG